MAQIPDFKVDLDTSPYMKLRQYLLTNHQAPKLSHANKNLGAELANLVFQHCDEALREDFGLTRPLKGPGNDLWTSPSDLLLGKLALKPPFTPKCLQALTHRGILEIGYGLEQKFREEMEMDKQRCLEAYKEELLASVEARMKSEIKDVEIRERLNCHMELEKQAKEFEVTLKNELKLLEEKLYAEYEVLLRNQEENLKEKWADIMREEVEHTVQQMTQDFLVQLDEQEEILTKNFSLELRKREALRSFDAKMHKRKTIQALRQLKHNLECTNLVNMMYILCTERQKCCQQKEMLEKYYKDEVKKLQIIIQKKDEELLELEQVKAHKTREIEIRETLLTEILKQFQKFINFAMKSAPTQAEFLLSVEKMMVFELTNAVSKKEFLNLTNENTILPWKYPEGKSLSNSEASSLKIKDFHNCNNELDPIQTGEERDNQPVVYFQDRRYVREEFRDILYAGIDLKPSNDLWSRDVQILIDTWRKEQEELSSVQDKDGDKEKREYEKELDKRTAEEKEADELGEAKSLRSSMPQQKSNVQFRASQGMGAGTITTRMSGLHEPPPIGSSEITLPSKSGRLMGASSKTEYKRMSSIVSGTGGQKKTSIRKASLKPTQICRLVSDVEFVNKDSIIPKASGSKLLGVRDSLELIKEKSRTRYSVKSEEQRGNNREETPPGEEIFVEIIEAGDEESRFKDDKMKTLKTFVESTSGRQGSEEITLDSVSHEATQSKELAMETKDSVILQKISLMKKTSTADFNASPVDSVELTRENREKSIEGIRSKSSRIASARNSITILRESLAKMNQPSPVCQKRNRTTIDASSQSMGSYFTPCCEKCKKEAGTHSQDTLRQLDETKSEKSVKISRIEVISLEKDMRQRTNSVVSFQRQATLYEPLLEDGGGAEEGKRSKGRTGNKSLSSKSSSKSTSSKNQPPKTQKYYDAYLPNRVQVLGDQEAIQGNQSTHEFTAERIHSMVNLLKEEPYLMQLFTACRR